MNGLGPTAGIGPADHELHAITTLFFGLTLLLQGRIAVQYRTGEGPFTLSEMAAYETILDGLTRFGDDLTAPGEGTIELDKPGDRPWRFGAAFLLQQLSLTAGWPPLPWNPNEAGDSPQEGTHP